MDVGPKSVIEQKIFLREALYPDLTKINYLKYLGDCLLFCQNSGAVMSELSQSEIETFKSYLEDSANGLPDNIRKTGIGIANAYLAVYSALNQLKRRQKDLLATLRRAMGIDPSKESPPVEKPRGTGQITTRFPKSKW